MSILVGIDGTGPVSDKVYYATYANSFVSKLCNAPEPNRRYFRGPITPGGGLLDVIVKGRRFILEKRKAGVNEPVLLTGHSRGAAGVIDIARQLQTDKIDVEAMLLFDCVDRHVGIDATVIPNNVGDVLHLRRAPESGSRTSFSNAGTEHRSPTRYNEAFFHCTHSGVGGVPWQPEKGKSPNDFVTEGTPFKTNVTYIQDAFGSVLVWAYALTFIVEHGFQ
jgi:hypothetical protein